MGCGPWESSDQALRVEAFAAGVGLRVRVSLISLGGLHHKQPVRGSTTEQAGGEVQSVWHFGVESIWWLYNVMQNTGKRCILVDSE